MSLKTSAEKIRKADQTAWVRRVMWLGLDERITDIFNRYTEEEDYTKMLGNIYLTKSREHDPIRSTSLLSFQHINSTHIRTGTRFLGVNLHDKEDDKFKPATERNCQLWYSQSSYGRVLVFVAPYISNAGEIEEKEIIIGKYKEPAQISCSDIKKHFETFFKYCACTSQNNASSLSNYLYRQYLLYKDFRYKASYKSKFYKLVERFAILVLGGAAVWATLYVGGKI
jgi:hypothetical protein